MAHPTRELPNYGAVPAPVAEAYPPEVKDRLYADAQVVLARYPQARSALLPLLHLVQSVDGYVATRGITFCAEVLDLTPAEVSGVATFYTQYKRHPNGQYTVGVCTNTLCAIMGGDQIWDTLSEHLGVGHDETTPDGMVTLERVECNAACDYAPVVMANWEFFDNQTPASAVRLVDDLRAGTPVRPTRGAAQVCTFREVSRVLAGFPDGRADQGPGAGTASLAGLKVARERGWHRSGDEPGGHPGEPGDQPGEPGDQPGEPDGATQPSPAGDARAMAAGRHTSVDTPANEPDEQPGGPSRKEDGA